MQKDNPPCSATDYTKIPKTTLLAVLLWNTPHMNPPQSHKPGSGNETSRSLEHIRRDSFTWMWPRRGQGGREEKMYFALEIWNCRRHIKISHTSRDLPFDLYSAPLRRDHTRTLLKVKGYLPVMSALCTCYGDRSIWGLPICDLKHNNYVWLVLVWAEPVGFITNAKY